jgi:hypothetical protein
MPSRGPAKRVTLSKLNPVGSNFGSGFAAPPKFVPTPDSLPTFSSPLLLIRQITLSLAFFTPKQIVLKIYKLKIPTSLNFPEGQKRGKSL